MRTFLEARRGQLLLRKLGLAVLTLVVMAGLPSAARALTTSVTLTPNVASPQKLGTHVTWTATVQNPVSGHTYEYQYTVTLNGQSQIVRDFNPINTFVWYPFTVEGAYQVSVVVRDTTTSPFSLFAPVSATYNLTPWVTSAGTQAVNPTNHPLVALFSGPPCTAGHWLIVRFQQASSGVSTTTSSIACSSKSANFLVAGMYPSTQYMMHWEEYDSAGLVNTGANLSFTTGAISAPFTLPTFQVNIKPTAHDAAYPVVFWHLIQNAVATDLSGNVLWYAQTPLVTRLEPGGNIFAAGTTNISTFDLAGNIVLETYMEDINEQLAAQGYPQITAFNSHEFRHLPNGDYVTLGYRDVVSTSAQGGTPSDPVDIIGDVVLVLNPNLQLVWAWDSFAHEDLERADPLDEKCTIGGPACPPFNPAFTVANDWLHTNFVQGTADGNIILSQRNQDMVLKINYANGTGDSSVLWRMGAGLDFTINNPPSTSCGTPNVYPWFTHQHDTAWDFEENTSGNGGTIMTVFDDGNTREAECPAPQNSRGMILFVNEAARNVTLETTGGLGGYSGALGSGQLLAPGDGNLYANYGNGDLAGPAAQATEINLGGTIVYEIQTNTLVYRSDRIQNLYTPSFPFTATGVYVQTATPFNYGTIPFGTTATKNMTVSNFGVPGTVTLGTSISGPSFNILSNPINTCPAGITGGHNCTLPVQFNPVSVGGKGDLLTISPSAGGAPAAVSLTGIASGLSLNFGTISFGTTKTLPLTYTNTSAGTVTLGTSINGPSFTILNNAGNTCQSGVAEGKSCTLQVQFNPVSTGGKLDTLTITPSAGAPVEASLQGIAD